MFSSFFHLQVASGNLFWVHDTNLKTSSQLEVSVLLGSSITSVISYFVSEWAENTLSPISHL